MKILTLRMKNFIVYKDECIDFRNFQSNSLFLITGKTGSGKSTIFDAIVFSLYGLASTDNRKGVGDESLIRMGADPNDEDSYVSIVFSSFNRVFKVVRYPGFSTINRNGNKKNVSQKVEIYQFTDDSKSSVEVEKMLIDKDFNLDIRDRWEYINTSRLNDANLKLIEIIGLNRDQFTKLILLPQNEFSSFLLSKVDEKADILKKIFPIDAYSRYVENIKDYVKDLEIKVNSYNQKIGEILNSIEVRDQVSSSKILENIQSVLEKLYAERDELNKEKSQLDENLRMLLVEKETKNAENQRLEVFYKNKKKLDDLNKHKKDAEDLVRSNKKLDLLKLVDLYENNYRKNQEELVSIKRNMKDQESIENRNYHELKEIVTKLLKKIDEIGHIYRAINAEVNGLKTEINIGKLSVFSEMLDLLEKTLSCFKANKKEDFSKDTAIIFLDNSADVIKCIADTCHKLDLRSQELNKEYEVIKEIDDLEKERKELREEIGELRKKSKDLVALIENKNEEIKKLESKKKKAGLYIYAEDLEAGKPCPLCGSIHHPNLIEKSDFKNQDLENARNDYRKMLVDQSKSETGLNMNEKKLEDLDNKILGKKAMLANEKESLANLEYMMKKNEFIKDFLFHKENELSSTINSLREEIKLFNTLSSEIDKDKLKLENMKLQVNDLEKKSEGFKSEMQNAIYDNFANLDEYKKIKEKKSYISENISWAEELLKELIKLEYMIDNNKDLEGKLPLDLSELEERIEKKENKLKITDDSIYINKLSILQYEDALKNLTSLYREYEKNIKIYNKADFLYQLASGRISSSMEIREPKKTLEAFVLSSYFDRILHFANMRLGIISNNRYVLRRKLISSGPGKQGLDIDIFDSNFSDYRQTKSLSGGEIFIVSLSLALGMADEIENSSGVVDVENLFIDEGFGFLDEDTLEDAMKVLVNLGENGKKIGIISHVESMKRSILNKIEVVKLGNGSSQIKVVAY